MQVNFISIIQPSDVNSHKLLDTLWNHDLNTIYLKFYLYYLIRKKKLKIHFKPVDFQVYWMTGEIKNIKYTSSITYTGLAVCLCWNTYKENELFDHAEKRSGKEN